MKYWDSSALVPLFVEESTTQQLTSAYLEDDLILTWWGSEVECASAIARLERDGDLTLEATTEALRRLTQVSDTWAVVDPGAAVRDTARRMLRAHDLRAADALQLAAAVIASENRPTTLPFVCLDRRLIEAATREGFPIVSA